jgi:tRNA(Ile2) C34 agmatinyltransferase TiaS
MAALAMRQLPLVSEPPRPRLVALPGGAASTARTLDDVLSGAWSQLRAGNATACPLCGGAMTARWTAGNGVVGGRCRSCGTEME